MAVISDEVRAKAEAKRKEIGSSGVSVDHSTISFAFAGWAETLEILYRVKKDEITNEQALIELDALDSVQIRADMEARRLARKAEEDRLRARTEKGDSLLDLLDSYTVIDLETTGLDPLYDSIIEIAAVHVEKGRIVDQFNTLVNPGYEIDDFIIELTGITNEMLASAPSIEKILPSFLDFVGADIILGHNVNFDINFLYTACERQLSKPFCNDFIDTMRFSRRLFPSERHHRLIDLVKRFNLGATEEHRALSDALQTHECYCYMKSYMEQHGIALIDILPVKQSHRGSCLRSKDIIANDDALIDKSSPFYQRVFVFTGTLEKMVRKDAMQLVVNRGGICGDSVNKKTNYLVLGNNDYCTTIRDGKSSKQKKAEELQLKGSDIEIISENVFYAMLNSND